MVFQGGETVEFKGHSFFEDHIWSSGIVLEPGLTKDESGARGHYIQHNERRVFIYSGMSFIRRPK